jgi:TATA element modulatory factor
VIQTQLDNLKREIKHLENEILKSQSHSQSLQETIQTLETRLTDQQTTFTKEKQSLEDSIDERLKEEKQKWEEEQQVLYSPPPLSATFPPAQFTFSPIASRPLPRNLKSVSPQPSDNKPPRAPFHHRTTSYAEISHLRRSSRGHFTHESLSLVSTPNLPIITGFQDDDEREFLSPLRCDSPRNTVIDAVSASTSPSASGPSVNIIERMSAVVRRLESDLASTKEEMSRAIKQRDEARNECMKLMSEVEEKRRFQKDVEQRQSRYGILENR